MYDFDSGQVANLSMSVNIDSDSNIATSGAAVVGAKKVTIQGFKTSGNLAQANTVFNKLIGGIGGGTYDSLTACKTLSQGVKEVE